MNRGVRTRTQQTLIMGVMNITPDSFYGPSRVSAPAEARKRADDMIADGGHIIDIGGESSRPGATPIGLEKELERIVPVLDALQGIGATLSIDTWRAETARQALARGATIVNDITALRGDNVLAGVIADAGAECVLMHMQGAPGDMQRNPHYDDVMDDISAFFEDRIAHAAREGIDEDRIWLDPGFGFGKTVEHNLEILRRLHEFKRFGLRLLVGTSNKSTIGTVLGVDSDDRLEGTAATVAVAIMNGVNCVRVHDVKAMARVARMIDAIMGAEWDEDHAP